MFSIRKEKKRKKTSTGAYNWNIFLSAIAAITILLNDRFHIFPCCAEYAMRSCVVWTAHEKKECSLPGTTSTQRAHWSFLSFNHGSGERIAALYPLNRSKQKAPPPDLDLEVHLFFFLDVFTVPLKTELYSSSGQQRECPGWPGGGVGRRADSNARKVNPSSAKKGKTDRLLKLSWHSYRTGLIPAVIGFSSLVWEVELHCDKQRAHCWFYQGCQ